MLTTTKHAAKPELTATPAARITPPTADLAFLSASQQLEGFPGRVSAAVAAHQPDPQQIVAAAQRFGAQVPTGIKPAKVSSVPARRRGA